MMKNIGRDGPPGRAPLRPSRVRELNRLLAMTALRESGPLSRGELARATRLSHSAIVGIVGELQERGLVHEVGVGESAGGRRPVLVQVSSSGPVFVGLHLFPQRVLGLLAAPDGTVMSRAEKPCDSQLGPDQVLDALVRSFEMVSSAVPEGSEVKGFGLSVAGPIGRDGKFDPPDMPGWEQHPSLLERLRAEIELPGVVDNDANLGALAELYFGEAAAVTSLVYVLVHHGIGAGVIVDGSVYGGSTNRAGELGHVIVDPDGPPCECGNYGCLETFVSTTKLVDYAIEGIRRGRPTSLRAEDPTLDAHRVIAAALDGDAAASRALEESGEWLGIGLANIINLFNPDTVVVGGPLAAAGSRVLEPAESIARQRLQPALSDSVRFISSPLGEDGPALGACALASDHFVTGSNEARGSTQVKGAVIEI